MWVSPNIGRLRAILGSTALLGALWLSPGPAFAQPLEPGVWLSDGRRFLLDDGEVKVFSKEFAEQPELEADSVTGLYQGSQGWEDTFLILTSQGLLRVSSDRQSKPEMVVAGEEVAVVAWGDAFLAHLPSATELFFLTPAGQTRLPLAGKLESLVVVDPHLALARSDESLFTLLREEGGGEPVTRVPRLPFPLSETQVASGQGRLYLWSPESQTLLDLVGDTSGASPYPAAGKAITLDEKPAHGVRVLPNGSAVVAGAESLFLIGPSGSARKLGALPIEQAQDFASWPMLGSSDGLTLLLPAGDASRVVRLPSEGQSPSQPLPAGKLAAIVEPEAGKPGKTLLFWATSFEEPKLDDDGREVLDPRTGKPVAPQTVHGHRIYALETDGSYTPVADEPRGMLVGPIERVGDRAIYATREEPVHQAGAKLDLDARFPYPKVILRGRSMSDPDDLWSFDKPRGEAPSKDRIPEDHWPLLGPGGPLLVTSEASNLLAISASDGNLQWQSPELPIDESSPPMLSWPDAFALKAAKSTARSLLVIDTRTGNLVETVTLTEVLIWEKWRHLLGVLIVCAALAYYIYAAGKRNLYIRKIAGLQALDEAVGRATEMGKPVLYVVGLADVDDIQTMASLSILSHVARKTAEYDTPIVTTTARAVAFSAAQEIVRDAFSVAGRPDAFSVESVRYISDDQFGYTAGVDGIMVREKPAANFYIGNFYAESLILAETGYATGSIQIAGTAQPSQVPFFVAACDYTLIGEELYAASAYISRDPLQVGSLRGQDVGKAIVMVLLLVCSLLVSMGVDLARISLWTGVKLP